MADLFARVARPIATPGTKNAWLAGRRLVTIDGTCLDVADTVANDGFFGRLGVAKGARAEFPQARVVARAECGTHAMFTANVGAYTQSEATLAGQLLDALAPGMLLIADRGLFSYALWRKAIGTGADLLWRVRTDAAGPKPTHLKDLNDGSWLAHLQQTHSAQARRTERSDDRRDHPDRAEQLLDHTVRADELPLPKVCSRRACAARAVGCAVSIIGYAVLPALNGSSTSPARRWVDLSDDGELAESRVRVMCSTSHRSPRLRTGQHRRRSSVKPRRFRHPRHPADPTTRSHPADIADRVRTLPGSMINLLEREFGVDDEPLLRQSLRIVIDSQDDLRVVGEAASRPCKRTEN